MILGNSTENSPSPQWPPPPLAASLPAEAETQGAFKEFAHCPALGLALLLFLGTLFPGS